MTIGKNTKNSMELKSIITSKNAYITKYFLLSINFNLKAYKIRLYIDMIVIHMVEIS